LLSFFQTTLELVSHIIFWPLDGPDDGLITDFHIVKELLMRFRTNAINPEQGL
jgi:hypothetical protein